MKKKTLTHIVVLIALIASSLIITSPASAVAPTNTTTITINADGTVSPSDVPIQRNGDTYTLTGDLNSQIRIMKGGITFDGAGYTLRGPYNGTPTWVVGEGPDQLPEGQLAQFSIGVDLGGYAVKDVTIKNLVVENFSVGMYIWTTNNLVTENCFSENQIAILLSGDFNNLTRNYISKSDEAGLFLGINSPGEIPPNFTLSQNTFDHNRLQFAACICDSYNESEPIHVWDDGQVGNYWSDYTGVDANGDGIGDTPYIIDEKNQDRYPLMLPAVELPIEEAPFPVTLVAAVLAVIVLVAVGLVVFWKRKR
ncbi:MAG: right-handed parallel beta-helix repeat-containing protein [Candidatus Bathyarchaeota archaeon]|nr:right-handed parallel beta-helix repeat-containing protein [Candidatus Bathyarchaeota archaeon]